MVLSTGGEGSLDLIEIEGPAFSVLEQKVLTPLARTLASGAEVRVWVPNCGDGTAAFAIALALLKHSGSRFNAVALKVFATECSPSAIERASRGQIGRSGARGFLRAGYRSHFKWTGDAWQLAPAVRGRIVFSGHDIKRDTPFRDIDLVFASTLLNTTPGACGSCALHQCVRALKPRGFIAVPPSFDAQAIRADLKAVSKSAGLYRLGARSRTLPRNTHPAPAGAASDGVALVERLAEHFAPAGLVVDGQGRIHAAIGGGSRLLVSQPSTLPSLGTATSMTFRAGLIKAFARAHRSNRPATERVEIDLEPHEVEATALTPSRHDSQPLWLLSVRPSRGEQPPDAFPFMEHLVATVETLRRSMDDAIARTWSLRTANDALQTTIDELEAANARLAATNAELTAVRQENENQIATLVSLNDEIDNLVQAADLAFLVLDDRARLRRYTPTAGRLFHLSENDIGKSLAAIVAPAMTALTGAVTDVLAGADSALVPLTFGTPPDVGAGLARIHPYRNEVGTLSGAIVTITDVTELKAAEDVLRAQNVALARANEDLERFAYIASHDLKSPLRSVRTMLEILRSDLGDVLSAENGEHLDLVADRVQQMERMIQDLLAYSRLGREGCVPETVRIGDVVRAQIDMLDVPETFCVVVEPDLPQLCVDRELFEHVVRNLIGNAIKHHDREDGRVEFKAVAAGGTPTFVVGDDGPGIPSRYHQRVFEIFQKAGSQGSREGSGMGLALVKKAVERNGGEIKIIAEDGTRGARFEFTWPEHEDRQASDQSV